MVSGSFAVGDQLRYCTVQGGGGGEVIDRRSLFS